MYKKKYKCVVMYKKCVVMYKKGEILSSDVQKVKVYREVEEVDTVKEGNK